MKNGEDGQEAENELTKEVVLTRNKICTKSLGANVRSMFMTFLFSDSFLNEETGSADAPPLKLSSLSVEQLIVLLREYPSQRGQAIHVLSQRRDENENLALALWCTPHITSILLLEVVGALKLLTPWKLTNREVERVCDALALFTLVASHKETRKPFLEARMPEYLYPFLKATVTGPPQVDHLKAISLSVIAGLVKDDDPDAVQFLLETEVFPDCVHCLEHGSETLNTYAACIISKILGQAKGIEYICDSVPRLHTVAAALGNVVSRLDETSSPSLLKHIINCYYKLSTETRVCAMLREILPAKLRTHVFPSIILAGDEHEGIAMLCYLYGNIIDAGMLELE